MDTHVRPAVEADLPALAELAARLQEARERHVVYLGSDADTIRAEVEELPSWWTVSAVATREDRMVGWLIGETDEEIGRVWWWGPFVASTGDEWREIVDTLYASARERLPHAFAQEEMAVDERFTDLVAWAERKGFVLEPGSAVLSVDLASGAANSITSGDVHVRALTREDAVVSRLHEALFPGTHLTGSQLLDVGDDAAGVRLVAELDGRAVGYIAADVQPDGDGYIDFLGVDESVRRRGYARRLITSGMDALREKSCRRVHLTVGESNRAARDLYKSLGFDEERVVVPLRKGFTLSR